MSSNESTTRERYSVYFHFEITTAQIFVVCVARDVDTVYFFSLIKSIKNNQQNNGIHYLAYIFPFALFRTSYLSSYFNYIVLQLISTKHFHLFPSNYICLRFYFISYIGCTSLSFVWVAIDAVFLHRLYIVCIHSTLHFYINDKNTITRVFYAPVIIIKIVIETILNENDCYSLMHTILHLSERIFVFHYVSFVSIASYTEALLYYETNQFAPKTRRKNPNFYCVQILRQIGHSYVVHSFAHKCLAIRVYIIVILVRSKGGRS